MKIQATLIIEIMGRPAEYIKETIEMLIGKMENEKGVKLLDKKIHEPKKIGGKEFFTTFAEIEVEADELIHLMRLVFVYMPSNVAIITPEQLTIKSTDLNEFLQEVTLRLHKYDEIAKTILIERQVIEKKLSELTKNSSPADKSNQKIKEKPNEKGKTRKKK